MFGNHIKEYQSIYISIITMLIILFLSYRWWIKEKKLKSLFKLIIIAVIGFIFYKVVILVVSVSVYLANTAKDHLFPETKNAIVIDYKKEQNRRKKGALFYPVVTYVNEAGHTTTATVDTGFAYSMAPKLQETVKIVTNDSNDEVRLITDVKTMLMVGEGLFVFLAILILVGITEYALALRTDYLQAFGLVSVFYIVIPLMIIGAGYFFGSSAYNYYLKNNVSSRFWIHISIAAGCILFMIGYANMLKEQFRKRTGKKKNSKK
ncbi:hypothetical protein C1631_001290 [Chryseobacterium phosphatilyticum]|uniref:DUF3592 domain-containing protein n=1 Tax=Chryseobacterium phosphatilyticum TaxID=475075 RepID=A0A316XEY4_9FLAO|nr:hypothetical protein [Chryseobacterium phosphatilyticum]PWN71286.1 hypothetical protein C1631_001290 [Chryseobacterium phosphatilyticum]